MVFLRAKTSSSPMEVEAQTNSRSHLAGAFPLAVAGRAGEVAGEVVAEVVPGLSPWVVPEEVARATGAGVDVVSMPSGMTFCFF